MTPAMCFYPYNLFGVLNFALLIELFFLNFQGHFPLSAAQFSTVLQFLFFLEDDRS